MDITVLQLRIRSGDQKAFLDLSNEYGWTLYSYLSQRIHNRDLVQSTYQEVLNEFYRNVPNMDQKGSVEAALLVLADIYCVQVPVQPEKIEKSSGLSFWIGLVILLLLNGLCLWIIGGILMEMGIIPSFDLGYSWIRTLLSI